MDPWTCEKFRLNSFINYAYGNLKFGKKDIKNAVVEIERKHKTKGLLEDPMIKRTLQNLIQVEITQGIVHSLLGNIYFPPTY